MDQVPLSSKLLLGRLLRTNRPLTDQERAVIHNSIPLTNAQLGAVQDQISEVKAHIEVLRSQINQAENKLQCLCEEEATLRKISACYRRVFAPIRNVTEDVIRSIFVACVDPKNYSSGPTLSSYFSLPYKLTQISSGMRRIALTTPEIWTTMNICMGNSSNPTRADQRYYTKLAAKAHEWFRRAGSLPLSVFFADLTPSYSALENIQYHPSSILFDTMLSYSTRWNRIQVESRCKDVVPSPFIMRIAALPAVDVPLLESITLYLRCGLSKFRTSPFISVPTLRRLRIYTDWDGTPNISNFTVNWSHLTSITIHGGKRDYASSIYKVARILQQTTCLVFCDIALRHGTKKDIGEINLPYLEVLCVDDRGSETASARGPNLFELINAPKLTVLRLSATFLDISLPNFFKRSAGIRELSLKLRLENEETLAGITESLHHCPSLSILTLEPREPGTATKIPDANGFLRAFIEDGGGGITCPCLQTFRVDGPIKFSFETLCQFLEVKQCGIGISNTVLLWKSVAIDMRGVDDAEKKEMLDLVSQKQVAGLDIRTDVTTGAPAK